MSNENNVGTYTRIISTEPETAQLLNYLVDTFVLPALQRRVVQGSAGKGHKRLSTEEELDILSKFTGIDLKGR